MYTSPVVMHERLLDIVESHSLEFGPILELDGRGTHSTESSGVNGGGRPPLPTAIRNTDLSDRDYPGTSATDRVCGMDLARSQNVL